MKQQDKSYASQLGHKVLDHYVRKYERRAKAKAEAEAEAEAKLKEAVWKWVWRLFVDHDGLSNNGADAAISIEKNERNLHFYKLAMEYGWLPKEETWYLEDSDSDHDSDHDSGDDSAFQIETDVDAQGLYNDMGCVRDEKFRKKFHEELADFCSHFRGSEDESDEELEEEE